MIRIVLAAALAGAAIASPLAAQNAAPTRSIVSIYRAAPGHQLALLKWFAQQDEAAKAAGVAASQLYIHQDGASWDFVLIQADTTKAQDDAIEAAQKKMGYATGPMAGLELRQHIAEHSDTFAAGPTTAADWLKRLGQ